MKTSIFSVVAFVALAFLAPAQIVGVELKPEAKGQYAKWAIERNGRHLICGDPADGFEFKPATGTLTRLGVKKVVVVVPDPAKPELVLGKDRRCTIEVDDIKDHSLLMVQETCVGLRLEYLRKRERLDESKKALGAAKAGTSEWFAAHRALMTNIDTLGLWLKSTLFPNAAKSLDAEYGTEAKRQGAQASRSRLDAAKKLSVIEVPESLPKKSREFGFGDLKWHGRETQHLKILAHGDINDSVIDSALQFGERIIDGYRTTFIDPFLAEGETDPIPEGRAVEWILVPDDEDIAAKLYEGWLGRRFGEPKAQTIKMKGHRGNYGTAVQEFWRHGSQDDLEGLVAHGLGHALASLHFARGGVVPAWVDEGFAYWISFEYLSRNSVTCFAFSPPPGYARAAQKEGTKTIELGLRGTFNDLALRKGPAFSSLIHLTLAEMSSADFAKSWSVIDFLLSTQKKKLVKLLREASAATNHEGRTNLETFRKPCEELYATTPGRDIYAEIDELWKAYAQTEQRSGGKK